MKNSLSWRFAIIIFIVAVAGYIVKTMPLLLGIDLAGGTSLLYELDLSKSQAPGESTSDLANRVVAVLKQRVDPNGLKNFIWRVVGDRRIQVQMPLADKATIAAREEVEQASAALEATTLTSARINRVLELQGEARTKALDELVPPSDPRNALIKNLAAANDAYKTATAAKTDAEKKLGLAHVPPDVRLAYETAKTKYDDAKAKVDATNVDINRLKSVLASADDPTNKAAAAELAKFPAEYPSQKPLIERFIAAHQKLYAMNGGGVDDPADLQRMLTAAGVLDFRITVLPTELGGAGSNDYQAAVQTLAHDGPSRSLTADGLRARWFEVDPKDSDEFTGPDNGGRYVMSSWAGAPYVLCYDDPSRALTHTGNAGSTDWTIRAGTPQPEPSSGEIALPFTLDAVGGGLMGDLTGGNMHRSMAILLDDRVMSAPTINGRISTNGEITFAQQGAAGMKEGEDLRKIMDAGSLPATLQREPISIMSITPDLGAENIHAGLYSGIYALIAVAAFMLMYYTITGFFADVALAINLLLVLAIMAFLRGTFTLPGIAGLVLTLGMAVDANVLINERIREEIHKGASLWMAVKQGYDKVFWTIFDANLTCSLTSIVLIYVGSEEVKGFGVTLLIGLCIHMFTALFITRTLMMASIKVGIIRAIDDHSVGEYFKEILTLTWLRKGRWPFMRVITVTNFDWIGKRHIFWVISAVITIAGMVAFFARGEDKYDIEFRGGTQVTFKLKDGATINGHSVARDDIEKLIKPLEKRPGLADLASARLYGVGPASEHTFQMQTTIANTKADPGHVKTALLNPLAEQLKSILNVTLPVSVSDPALVAKFPELKAKDSTQRDGDYTKLPPTRIADLMDAGLVEPIEAPTLDKVFEHTPTKNIPNLDVSDELHGVAILFDNMKPPQTVKQLTDRITETRGSEDPTIHKIPTRAFKIIPLAAANGEQNVEGDNVPLTRAVMVSKDDSFPYQEGSQWRHDVAGTEWYIAQTALQRETLFQGVTSFDAVVAGQAKTAALIAIILSLILIVAYVWVRFGGIRYGIGAIFSLIHDAVVALAATVLAKYLAETWFGPHLLIIDFKINLTMIAAYLTVIGYSVNDTIVIFDRVRELRGKSNAPLSPRLVNDAINQCFGRTIWTTFTVFIVVLIMYVFGGEGVRGFSYAMLVGVITGGYSTLAIASPMLLATASAKDKGLGAGKPEARYRNPFLQPEDKEKV